MSRAMTISESVNVGVTPERAFEAFTDLQSWWPREYTWSRDVLDEIAIEPREGGRLFEIGPHGFHCDFGRVLAWEPGRRLVFTWQIGPQREPEPNPERASEVEVRFGDGRVELEHRGFERHGEAGEGYAAALGSEHGWRYMLGSYAEQLG
jgi:uncharacterized protein YndB with AHSA1/START domain